MIYVKKALMRREPDLFTRIITTTHFIITLFQILCIDVI